MNKPKRKPKQPKKPNAPVSKQLPVTVSSYFKNGKMVRGHKRHSAGDAGVAK